MSAGVDSLGATELVSTLGDNMSIELEPTVLFDHPTIESLAKLFE
jgi:acyl carrier protein